MKTPLEVIPHGFDPMLWKPADIPKDIDVLTVGTGFQNSRVRHLKGVDRLLTSARLCPELRFMIIGWEGSSEVDIPSNVTVLPRLEHEQLLNYYQRSRSYAQLSLSEGFGCALVEAMFCGCVPVVNDVGAMPDILANLGVVVRAELDDELASGLKNAASQDLPELSKKVVRHARSTYPISLRGERIHALVRSLASGSSSASS